MDLEKKIKYRIKTKRTCTVILLVDTNHENTDISTIQNIFDNKVDKYQTTIKITAVSTTQKNKVLRSCFTFTHGAAHKTTSFQDKPTKVKFLAQSYLDCLQHKHSFNAFNKHA